VEEQLNGDQERAQQFLQRKANAACLGTGSRPASMPRPTAFQHPDRQDRFLCGNVEDLKRKVLELAAIIGGKSPQWASVLR
jgi:hypothetical protein